MDYRPELIGGHLALDLVNTVTWRLDDRRRLDRLADPANLRRWLTATGLGPLEPGAETELLQTRETAYAVLHPLAVGAQPAHTDLAELRSLIENAVRNAELVGPRPLTWRAGTVADRVRQCGDDDCGWLFLDRSKNGSRRWCSSADCGNRARARRHYQRRHSEAST